MVIYFVLAIIIGIASLVLYAWYFLRRVSHKSLVKNDRNSHALDKESLQNQSSLNDKPKRSSSSAYSGSMNKAEKNTQQDTTNTQQQNISKTSQGTSLKSEHFTLSIIVQAKHKEGFETGQLLQELFEWNIQRDDKGILHYIDAENIMRFSIVMLDAPHYFKDLHNLKNHYSYIRGLVLYYQTRRDPIQCFDIMLHIAYTVAKKLDADLYNDNEQIITPDNLRMYYDRLNCIQ